MSDTDHILEKVQMAFKAAFDIDPQLVTIDTRARDISLWDSVGHLSLGQCLGRGFRD